MRFDLVRRRFAIAESAARYYIGLNKIEKTNDGFRHKFRFLVAGILLMMLGGYLLTYGLFFKEINIEVIGEQLTPLPKADFKYKGVSYFHGMQITHQEKWELSYVTPRLARWVPGKTLELYVEVPDINEKVEEAVIGTITVAQSGSDHDVKLAISADINQRFQARWEPASNKSRLSVEYLANEGYEGMPLNFAVVVSSFATNSIGLILIAIGILLILAKYAMSCGIRSKAFSYVSFCLLTVLIAFWFHSGGFISEDFFGADTKRFITGQSNELRRIINTGHSGQHSYRDLGATLVPFLTLLIEGKRSLIKDFSSVYPTQGYVFFLLFIFSTAFLSVTLAKLFGRRISLIFFLLSVTFFPYIADIYEPDSDALLIFYFALLVGLFIRIRYLNKNLILNGGAILFLFLVIGATKLNLIYMALLLPLAFFYKLDGNMLKRLALGGLVFVVLVLSFSAGKSLSNSFKHPDRNVGIEGEPFQKTIVWHMIWAAYGLYDDNSAHEFTKGGSLRNERVSKITGLPPVTYLRHSQTATEKVYKPQVIRAFRESPGYFYSIALWRMHDHGFKFYRFTRGPEPKLNSREWLSWLSNEKTESVKIGGEVIKGEAINRLGRERHAIHYDKAWKISPLIFLAKITQKDLPYIVDSILFVLSILGVFLIKEKGVKLLLLGSILVMVGFDSFVHGLNRYFVHCSYAFLIGFSVFLHRFYVSLDKAGNS